MQREHDGLLESPNEIDEPLAALSAEEPVFVLNVDQINGILVDEARRCRVTCPFVLRDPADDFGGIPADVTARFVERDNRTRNAKRAIVCVDYILRKGGNSALAGRVRTQE